MRDVVVDANVAVVANGNQAVAPECVLSCIDALAPVMDGTHRLVLDVDGAILAEYLRQRPHGFPQGPGDQFIVEMVTFQATPDRCTQVGITPDNDRGYVEFPADAALSQFDMDDRKYVAVAIAHGARPPIINAVDTDWQTFAVQLAPHVTVREVC